MRAYLWISLVSLLWAGAAHGDITAESPTTDWHAYTLNSNEFRIGIHTLEYGILDRAEIGVAHYLWLFKVRNGFGKLRVYDTEDLSVSLSAGYLNFNTADLEVKEKDAEGNVTSEPNIDLFSVTAGLNISKRLKSFTLSGSLLAFIVALMLLDGLNLPFSLGTFTIELTPRIILTGLATGIALGTIGTLPPALRCLQPTLPVALRSS